MRSFAGIDPGKTGAMAIFDEQGQGISFLDFQEDLRAVCQSVRSKDVECPIALAVLENVHPMPREGVSSSFKFGTNFGIWQAILTAYSIPFQLITPHRWRRVLDSSVPAKPSKEDLRLYAIRRWPEAAPYLHRKRDHGRAEALIMAEYARQTFLQRQ